MSVRYSYLSRCERGSILVVSIWVLVFFSILSAALYGMASTQIKLTKVLEERTSSPYLAKSACVYARLEREKNEAGYDTIYELTREREMELGRAKFSYTQIDEESRVNINTSSLEVISRLPGISPELAENIINYPRRPFYLKEELLLVDGLTQEAFDQLKDLVTVYSNGKVNINTASGGALGALGLEGEVITAIEDYRKGPDAKEGTEDDGFFENTQEIADKLQLEGEEEQSLNDKLGLLCVKGDNLFLNIYTEILGRKALRFEVVMGKDRIKEWREY